MFRYEADKLQMIFSGRNTNYLIGKTNPEIYALIAQQNISQFGMELDDIQHSFFH